MLMPSWVAPALAAEFWGVGVEQVLAEVAAGRVGTWAQCDLLFVDVAPQVGSHRRADLATRASCRRSLAWAVAGAQTVVTPAERDALLTLDGPAAEHAAVTEPATDAEARVSSDTELTRADELRHSVHDEGEPAPLADGPEDGPGAAAPLPEEPPQWDAIRSRVSRTRKPPARGGAGG